MAGTCVAGLTWDAVSPEPGAGVPDGVSLSWSWDQQSQQGGGQNVKHRLLRVVRRLFQYEALLTGGPQGGRMQRPGGESGGAAPAERRGTPGLPLWLDGRAGRRRRVGRVKGRHPQSGGALTSPSYLVRNRTLGPPLENNPEIPPSSRDEGLHLLHGLATNLATSLQTPQEA